MIFVMSSVGEATAISATRQALVLQAWEAVSTERHLQDVLAAVSDVLLPFVQFDSLAIVHFDGQKHDLLALHTPGCPFREGETLEAFLARNSPKQNSVPPRPLRSYNSLEIHNKTMSGIAHVVSDLLAEDAWYEHEFDMARGGVRAYCSIPLLVRGKLIGVAAFSRSQPIGYTEEELTILGDVTRALAVAVSNAVAYEEIRRLRSQLEAENIALRAALKGSSGFEEIVGDSLPLRSLLERVEQVAATDATVLITGETGTGKELIARAIHRRSPRAGGPMVKVNCAAIPETLIASELFGHERGAFTGAVERRKGRFEQAHGGTLFLDEIGELPPETQALLLRVLQEREFERIGSATTLRADVRVVTATNRDLAEQVRAGRFRGDLFYRLNVFPVHMPPLRDRLEDIPALVAHFSAKYGEFFKRPIQQIEQASLQRLASHDWPGNVRELENVVERAVILASNGVLRIQRDLFPSDGAAEIHRATGGNMNGELRAREKEAIEAALKTARGRVSGPNGAAQQLNMPASTLEFRIRKLAIDKHRFKNGR